MSAAAATATAEAVLERWAGAAAAAAPDGGRVEAVARWARVVVARYEEPQRHYHTGAHVAHLLALAEEQERVGILNDPANVAAAILFHEYGTARARKREGERGRAGGTGR